MKKELDSSNPDTTIHNVCSECGLKASEATFKKKWIKSVQYCHLVSTYHKWICDYCKEEKSVTQTRDFYYPDFNLIEQWKINT